MAYENFFRIKDYTETDPLWGGEEVYILADAGLSISGANTVLAKPTTMGDIDLTEADTDAGDTGSDYNNNFSRRRSNVSYSGLQNQLIPITAMYNTDIGSGLIIGSDTHKVFTAHKLYELILKPRTVYLKDKFLIELLASSEDTSPAVYSTKGIPIILDGWTITTGVDGREVMLNMSFQEDK